MNENNIQEQAPYQNDYRVFHWPKWRTWKRIILALFIVLFVSDMYLNFWVNKWVDEQIANDGRLTPQKIEEIRQYWDKTIDFPGEWVKEKPVSKELAAACAEAESSWNDLMMLEPILHTRFRQWMRINNVYIEDEEKMFLADMEKAEPFIQAALNLSKAMKQEAERGSSCFDYPDLPASSNLFENEIIALTLKARALTLQDERDKALDCYLATLSLMIANPVKYPFYYYYKPLRMNEIIPEIASIFSTIEDPQKLRTGLDVLNGLESYLIAGIDNRSQDILLLSNMYAHRSEIDLTPGKKAKEYIKQYERLMYSRSEFSYSVYRLIMTCFSNRKLKNREKKGTIITIVRPFVFTRTLHDYLLICATPFLGIFPDYDNMMQAKLSYDTLRLQIAARLYVVENGKKVTATTDLVPKYIPKELVTPESKNPYQWNSEGKLIVPFFQ